MAAKSGLRLADVMASLCLATDLAVGQQLEHGLRRTLLAIWLGAETGLDDEQLRDSYFVALLGSVGCVIDVAAMAKFVQDDIAFRGDMFPLDMVNPVVATRYMARVVGRGDSPVRRAAKFVGITMQANAICRDVAMRVGGVLDLSPQVRQALGQCDEHWNGKGGVLGLKGDQISIHAQLFLLAQDIEVFYRIGGTPAAIDVVKRRAGTYYNPELAAYFLAHADELISRLQVASTWDAVLDAEPGPPRMLAIEDFDIVAHQVANFIDMRSVYTVGHSPAVARLAESAAIRLGLGPHDALTLRSAGLLHDLGRAGVPVALWNKSEPLTALERERIEQHPAFTELLLARSTALGRLGTLAGLHHERLDGSGYRGVTASSLSVTARVLAVADAYQSKLESRAYRPAMTPEEAEAEIRSEVDTGKLDGDVAAAVLDVAGHAGRVDVKSVPAGLTRREVEVLGLIVRGMSNREVAEHLTLSQKTVGNHIEHIYEKTGVSTRVGATLFAIEHGLIAPVVGQIRR